MDVLDRWVRETSHAVTEREAEGDGGIDELGDVAQDVPTAEYQSIYIYPPYGIKLNSETLPRSHGAVEHSAAIQQAANSDRTTFTALQP